MNPDAFLEKATNPQAWFDEARSLRVAALAVWGAFLASARKSAQDNQTLQEAFYLLRNSQLLYALCAECALKALIIKRYPRDVSISIVVDGKRQVSEATIARLGSLVHETHNLTRLAEIAKMLPKDAEELRNLLDYCTECIKWIGRYPVPLQPESNFQGKGQSSAFFGITFLDLMDEFLNEVFKEFKR